MALTAMPKCSSQPPVIEGRRIGVFGGTFDPIHIGHLVIAEEARVRLALAQVLFVPARVSPLKLPGTFFSAEDRLAMVELAIADNPGFAASRVDLDREGPSFTVDTLRRLREACAPQDQLYFIMGADSVSMLHRWRQATEIIRLARIVAVSRPGFSLDLAALEPGLPGLAAATDLITAVHIGVSSTDLRRRLEEGRPIRYQVPAAVEAYIHAHHLVKEPGEPAR
jgi:nicotinate-nucleotide adenylyltransferase